MSFLLKKVIKPWNSNKDTSNLPPPETPMCPPSPDLSHLTPDEISVINDVIKRQEEFERQEAARVKALKEELENLQQQLAQGSLKSNNSKKVVDLRLCRLCFKTKFADGVGRVCHDCQQRVCQSCGSFSKPRWNAKKNKSVRGRWRCKLCTARREVLCRTGSWYHGTPDPSHFLKKKLSIHIDPEVETDAGSSTNSTTTQCQGNNTNVEDGEHVPSGNRTDSELLRSVTSLPNPRIHNMKKNSRRRSLPQEAGNKDEKGDEKADYDDYDEDDDEDDKDSLNSLILERRLSRRKRQEKRQRRKLRAGQDQRSTESLDERPKAMSVEEGATHRVKDSGHGHVGSGSGQRRDSVTRSMWGQSNSLNSCVRKPSPINESRCNSTESSVTESSIFSSFRDSSLSDGYTESISPTPMSLKIMRQDAVSLNSSCISFTSTSESKIGEGGRSHMGSCDLLSARSRESLRPRSPIGQDTKIVDTRNHEGGSPKVLGEKSLQKWKQAGFLDAYLISLHSQPRDCPYGLRVTGGIQNSMRVSRTLVTWVSSELKSKVSLGQEVLEWNGETLRSQTFDMVSSLTTRIYPLVVLIINPSTGREDGGGELQGPIVITPERPPSHSPELHGKGGKRRMLPRTPVEIKRGTRRVKGEIQIKLFYHPGRSTLSITVLRASHLASTNHVEATSPSPFVVISLVPGKIGRDSLETDLRTSNSHPEWEQTFLLDGISLTELMHKALQLTVWSCEEKCDIFIGEVLLDLSQAPLDNQAQWYNLEEHDENSASLPQRRGSHSASLSGSWTSGSFRESTLISPIVSSEVPYQRHQRHSPSSIGSANVSPVPFGMSQVGSREFHLNSVSQPDSFTTKVRKKMRNTVSKMSSLSLIEKRDNAGSDESSHSEIPRRLSDKSDRSMPLSKSPISQRRTQGSHHSMDLLAPPQPPSRTNSSSSFFLSDDEDSRRFSASSVNPDRPPPEGDDITSTLGPGQIPPKPSAETTVCGDIKLGFMVSKGQLEVDIICASGLHKSGESQPPDTYVKTYLVEGKKVIQRKKTLVVKNSFDPVYRKKINYSAVNVHGRIMKIDVWERTGSFEKKICRGEVLVRLDGLDLSKHTMAWYKLFQINSTDYGSDEYLNSW